MARHPSENLLPGYEFVHDVVQVYPDAGSVEIRPDEFVRIMGKQSWCEGGRWFSVTEWMSPKLVADAQTAAQGPQQRRKHMDTVTRRCIALNYMEAGSVRTIKGPLKTSSTPIPEEDFLRFNLSSYDNDQFYTFAVKRSAIILSVEFDVEVPGDLSDIGRSNFLRDRVNALTSKLL